MLKSKRGISGVVVAVLIVLIAVIAVGIFWAALKPTIEGTTEKIGKGEDCLYLNLNIQELNATQVKVHRDAGEAALEKVKILVNGEVESTETNKPGELETKTYAISALSGDLVEIAGILEGDITCTVSDSATVE